MPASSPQHAGPESEATAPGPSPAGEVKPRVRVAVAGIAGRMGREVGRAIHADPDCVLVGAVDVAPHAQGRDAGQLAGVGELGVPVCASLAEMWESAHPEVLVDFTIAPAAFVNAQAALERGVSPVIGTTGLTADQVETLRRLASERATGAFIAPNFSIGAVLMMVFARQAARYLPEVEIIELHHEKKVDAPSGTALRTAQLILETRGLRMAQRPSQEDVRLEGARGGDLEGIRIHSVRLPGYVAHQEVIFGGHAQTLTIRHDSTDRTSFMPGMLLAVKRVRSLSGLVVGLENLLDLE
ncbi:MAG: 4-hydroxy-tetrahydrodipicolinate reductase [Armatimonadetes bacterium]|nr:4-hydroxy-tetrahydrodipicolinate reductase [Armatimonadota bacterium]